MSMHLHHPSLSFSGKKKGKQKFRSAADAQRARELEQSWNDLKKKHGVAESKSTRKNIVSPVVVVTPPVHRVEQVKPKSLNSWITGAVSSKPTQQYTGDQMVGLTVIHKSCIQPVFNKEAAVDAAKMRRG
jgi:hypothetical protein